MRQISNLVDTIAIDIADPAFAPAVQQYNIENTPFVIVSDDEGDKINEEVTSKTISKLESFKRIAINENPTANAHATTEPVQPEAPVVETPTEPATPSPAVEQLEAHNEEEGNKIHTGEFERTETETVKQPEAIPHEIEETTENHHIAEPATPTTP